MTVLFALPSRSGAGAQGGGARGGGDARARGRPRCCGKALLRACPVRTPALGAIAPAPAVLPAISPHPDPLPTAPPRVPARLCAQPRPPLPPTARRFVRTHLPPSPSRRAPPCGKSTRERRKSACRAVQRRAACTTAHPQPAGASRARAAQALCARRGRPAPRNGCSPPPPPPTVSPTVAPISSREPPSSGPATANPPALPLPPPRPPRHPSPTPRARLSDFKSV